MAINAVLRWAIVAGLFVAAPLSQADACAPRATAAQDAKAEFDKKLAKTNQNDPKALFEVAKWADDNGLKTESKRLARQVIKLDPEHVEARAMLGYQKYEGKWLTTREIEREKAKKEESDKASKGLKKWKGEWVPAADYEKYEKGLVPVEVSGDKKWVTPAQKERIEKGLVLYKGLWVSPEDKEHLDKGEFKASGKWVTKDEADKFHSEFTNPWEFEGEFAHFTTTCTYDFAQQAIVHADKTVQQVYSMLGVAMPKEFVKVDVIMVKDRNDYNQLGNGVQGDDALMSSAYSTFVFKDQNTDRHVGVTIYEEPEGATQRTQSDNFSLMHARHAAAAAALRNMTLAEQPPTWFLVGVATYCERYWDPTHSDGIKKLGAWSLANLNTQGGVLQLKHFFEKFTVTKQTILQSGLVVSYLMNGTRTPKVEEQWKGVLETFKAEKQKGLEKKFVKLELALDKEGEKELDAFSNQLSGR